jgi:hypothetical protein
MFRGARHTWLGRDIDALLPERSEACEGALFHAVPSHPGAWVRIEGWAWDPASRRVPGTLLVTNAEGVVMGLGEPEERRGPWTPREALRARRFVAWRGPGERAARGDVWAVLDARTACRIAGWRAHYRGARESTSMPSPAATAPAETVVQ